MGGMSVQATIVGIIGVVIASIAGYIVLPMMIGFTDGLALRFTQSCGLNDERFVKAFVPVTSTYDSSTARSVYDVENGILYGPGILVVNADGACNVSAFSAAEVVGDADGDSATLYNERGSIIASSITLSSGALAAATAVSDGRWLSPPRLFNRLGGVASLILDVLPVLIIVGFLSSGLTALLNHSQGIDVSSHIRYMIGKLLGTIALLVSLPFALDQLAIASYTLDSGVYTVQERFGSLSGLVLAAIPVLILTALLSWQGFDIAATYRTVKSSGYVGKMKDAMKFG